MLETERTDRKDRASSLLNKEVGKESIVQAAGNGTMVLVIHETTISKQVGGLL